MANEALMALRSKRMEGMGKMDANPVEEAVEAPEGDMAEYWQRLQDMDAKIDQILALVGGKQEAPVAEVPEVPAA